MSFWCDSISLCVAFHPGTRCPRLIMSTSCPSPGVSHFSKVPWCLREHSLCKSLSPVKVKQTSSSHNRWSDLFWCSQERQMLQRNLTAFKILASGWPCRKRPWRKAQKNQAQLSSHPSRWATGQELTGVRRGFSWSPASSPHQADISNKECQASSWRTQGVIPKCVIVSLWERRGGRF